MPSLREVLEKHAHSYDSDCGDDGGCICHGYEPPSGWEISHSAYSDHLAAVIESAFDLTSKEEE